MGYERGVLRPVQAATLAAEQEVAIARTCPGLGERIEAAGRSDDPVRSHI